MLKGPNDWKIRHDAAMGMQSPRAGHEQAMVAMVKGWQGYAQAHRASCDSPIGDDHVLGPEWEAIGRALVGLLNGDCGPRLDCGTLDGLIRDTLKANGFQGDDW